MDITEIESLEALKQTAARVLDGHPRGAVVGLRGDLGAGKTTFVRLFVETICERMGRPQIRVTSPTYVLHQSYPDLVPPVDHYDLYRLNVVTEEALIELGYPDVVAAARASQGWVFVEWPQRAQEPGALDMELDIQILVSGDRRTVFINDLAPQAT